MHLGIAEQGKLYALKGQHKDALVHYKEAMKMVEQQKQPEVFAQHYLQCILESLELSGAHQEVLDTCYKLLNMLEEQTKLKGQAQDLLKRHMASVQERIAVQHLLLGHKNEAKEAFIMAQKLAGKKVQPLTDRFLEWLQRGYAIMPNKLKEEQKKYNYFIVDSTKIRPEIAVDLKNNPAFAHLFS